MEKQHFDILLENMDSKFNILMEGFGSLSDRIDNNHRELKGDVSLLDEKISVLSQRVSSVEANLGAKIDSVHSELIDHRNNSEMHRTPAKRSLKKAA